MPPPNFDQHHQNATMLKENKTQLIMGSKIMSFLGIPLFIICAVVISLIINSKRLREKKSNQLLLNLCIGHLLTGLACFYGWFSVFQVGKFVFAGQMYSTVALICLSIDRYIFIRQPFRYDTVKAYNRVHIIFMVFSPLVYMIYFYDGVHSEIYRSRKGNFALTYICIYFVTVVVLFFLNISTYITACKQRKTIKRQCKQLVVRTKIIDGACKTLSNSESTNSKSTDITSTNLTSTNSTLANSTSRNSISKNSKSTISTSTNSTSRSSKSTNSTTKSDSVKHIRTNERTKGIRSFYLCFGCVITYILFVSPSVMIRVVSSSRFYSKSILEMTLVLTILNPLSDLLIFVWFNVELRNLIMKKLFRKKIVHSH